MFVHKSKPLALSFACTAAAMVMGLAASPAQADRQEADQQNSYCSAPEVCNQRQIGIIQKTRDGVNYFYGGSDVAPPSVSYIYLIDNDQPVNQSINTSNLYRDRALRRRIQAPVQDEEGPLEMEWQQTGPVGYSGCGLGPGRG